MILRSPFFISSRLLPAIKVGGGTIQLQYSDLSDTEGRTRYKWVVDLESGKSFSGNDLRSGVGGGNLKEGFISLLSFLSACGESFARHGEEGENSDLFPLEVAKWAADNCEEISFALFEIEEGESEGIEE